MTDDGERLLAGPAGRLFVALTLGIGAIKVGKFVLPPLLPAIIADLSITPFLAGVALSALSATYALVQFPAGRLSDRLSRGVVVVAGLGFLLAGFALLAATPTYAAFVLGTALLGASDGAFSPASRALLSDLYVRRRGEAFGVHMAFIDIGGIVASGLAIAVLAAWTWRGAFLVGVALAVPVLGIFHRWRREPYSVEWVPLDARGTVDRLFGDADIRRLVAAYSLYVFTWEGAVGFLPAYLRAEHGLSAELAGATFAGLFVVGILVKPVSGNLSDRGTRMGVATWALAVAGAGIGLLVVAPAVPVAVAGVLVYAAGHKSFAPAVQAHLMDAFPEEGVAGDFGAFRTVYQAVGSLGPAFVGFAAGRWGYAPAFAGLAATTLAALAVLVASR